MGTAAFIVSIIGLILAFLNPILAIIIGIVALVLAIEAGKKNEEHAKTAKTISIVSIVVAIIVELISLFTQISISSSIINDTEKTIAEDEANSIVTDLKLYKTELETVSTSDYNSVSVTFTTENDETTYTASPSNVSGATFSHINLRNITGTVTMTGDVITFTNGSNNNIEIGKCKCTISNNKVTCSK